MNRAYWCVWLYENEGCNVDELAAYLKMRRSEVVDRLRICRAIQAKRDY